MVATIKDIAQKTGVSAATVSRVLTNKEGFFGDKTAKKVRDAAKELGYRKNTSAMELVTKKSNDLAVIVNATKTNFSNAIIDGIQEMAFPQNLNVIILYAGDEDSERQRRAINTVVERSVMGVLLLSVDLAPKNLELLQSANIPFCFLSISLDGRNLPFISSDDYQIGYQATKYLLDRGHTKIGLAGLEFERTITGVLRLKGYHQALLDAGVEPKSEWTSLGDYSYEAGQKSMTDYGAKTELTAVVCGSDWVAIGVMNQARSFGLAVPDDLSIVAIDGTNLCEIVQPQLTSVTQSFYDMGVAGVNWLLDSKKRVDQKITPITINERESVRMIR
ncbi:LacI family DNA-binding transcriptional regulator [Companilactobacillus sp.]|uniref:LacI family DNA-binding transcriptional regulator n=1 Tax=Companilactobacillus sp. TaxID=2767905 RepID=UPI0025C5B351|nr:LacI family DNA-binding transcriptional regulator [Companilactobacillus sp.]MCH4009155.1 LacI family transcriptional regulator [Companilactobacillus sp.]MCH4050666.1 LacI family transcriptional regulator [Companilactobacillus sp.]MCH4077097.1 LacI family transcriptional regulator [Companilactobacillus sp.]MCH4125673.1 LacI family transcriptional regulator [Companilactobacillus sp.]MCI1311382.1 LacI family transcriptional regulator [Companilactobacillus sp.]